MWEIESNSVGSGLKQGTVRPGQTSCVGSPPTGCRQNRDGSIDKTQFKQEFGQSLAVRQRNLTPSWLRCGMDRLQAPLGVLAMTLVACVWTWGFSFPAFMAWSHATSQATQALNGAKNSPKLSNGAPVHPCVNVTRGSVGPMSAPLRECTITSPEGDAVFFTPRGPHSVGGMAYMSSGSHWFADECAHHSYGPWWTFTASTDGVGDCPFGYSFHGGG